MRGVVRWSRAVVVSLLLWAASPALEATSLAASASDTVVLVGPQRAAAGLHTVAELRGAPSKGARQARAQRGLRSLVPARSPAARGRLVTPRIYLRHCVLQR